MLEKIFISMNTCKTGDLQGFSLELAAHACINHTYIVIWKEVNEGSQNQENSQM
jgi:hypothetical protein